MLLPVMSGWFALPAVNFVVDLFRLGHGQPAGLRDVPEPRGARHRPACPAPAPTTARSTRRTPAQIAQQITDSLVAQMVTDGDIAGALAHGLRRAAHASPDDLVAQRRYHRVLLLAPDKTATLLDHGRPLHRAAAARATWRPRRSRSTRPAARRTPDFVLEDPPRHDGAGAGRVAQRRCACRRWRCCRGFDKRFRGHAAIPQAYELAARVLVQGLNRRDMAQPILTTLEARYPESEQTQEVRWLLRERACRAEPALRPSAACASPCRRARGAAGAAASRAPARARPACSRPLAQSDERVGQFRMLGRGLQQRLAQPLGIVELRARVKRRARRAMSSGLRRAPGLAWSR